MLTVKKISGTVIPCPLSRHGMRFLLKKPFCVELCWSPEAGTKAEVPFHKNIWCDYKWREIFLIASMHKWHRKRYGRYWDCRVSFCCILGQSTSFKLLRIKEPLFSVGVEYLWKLGHVKWQPLQVHCTAGICSSVRTAESVGICCSQSFVPFCQSSISKTSWDYL